MTTRYTSLFLSAFLLLAMHFSVAQTERAQYFPENAETIDETPPDVEELYLEGVEDYNRGYLEDALMAFNQVISLKPDYSRAYFERARTREALKDVKGALTDYTIVTHLTPQFTEAYFNRAILYYDNGHYSRAIADLQKLLEIPVDETNIVYFKGVSYGHPDAAPTLGGVISMAEKNVEIWQYIGKAKTKLKDFTGALEAFDRAIAGAPGSANLYVERGIAYGLSGQPKMAIKDYKAALTIDQNHGLALYNLALESSRSGNNEISLATYDEIIQTGQAIPAVYLNRALLYYNQGNYKKALSDYNKAISLDPKNPLAFINRGLVAEKLQQHAEALRDFSRAIQLDPSMGKAYISRGNLYFKTKAYQKSLEDYSRALNLGIVEASIYYNRALAYHELNQKENACEDLTRALEMGMNHARKPFNAYCQ